MESHGWPLEITREELAGGQEPDTKGETGINWCIHHHAAVKNVIDERSYF